MLYFYIQVFPKLFWRINFQFGTYYNCINLLQNKVFPDDHKQCFSQLCSYSAVYYPSKFTSRTSENLERWQDNEAVKDFLRSRGKSRSANYLIEDQVLRKMRKTIPVPCWLCTLKSLLPPPSLSGRNHQSHFPTEIVDSDHVHYPVTNPVLRVLVDTLICLILGPLVMWCLLWASKPEWVIPYSLCWRQM